MAILLDGCTEEFKTVRFFWVKMDDLTLGNADLINSFVTLLISK